MTNAFKEDLRRAITKASGLDPGEVYPEAFFGPGRGAVVHSVVANSSYPRTNTAFLTRSGELVCITQTGLN